MSVRAYRVKKIDYVTPNSFNLWHDDKLVDFLDSECDFFAGLTNEGTGLVEVPVEALQKAVEKLELDDELRKALMKDIEACRDDGYVTYYCF